MSRVRKPRFATEKFTLFPFLDALSGVVGVLALVISSLSLLAGENQKLVFDTPQSKTEKHPHYVECVEGGAVLHPEKIFVPQEQMAEASGPWEQFIDNVKNKGANEYVVLLIRTDGFDSYRVAMQSVQSYGIDVGREIVAMAGEIEIQQEK